MQKTITVILLLRFIHNCSVLPDFNFATMEEQINFAGIILTGTVTAVSDPINEAVVSLNNLQYYRGCLLDKQIKIAGFRGSSLCGAGIPRVGDNIIVFACEDDTNQADLKTNTFTLFTGWVDNTSKHINQIKKLTNQNTSYCNPVRRSEKCLNRDNSGQKKQNKPIKLEKPQIQPIDFEQIPNPPVPPLPLDNEFNDITPPTLYWKPYEQYGKPNLTFNQRPNRFF